MSFDIDMLRRRLGLEDFNIFSIFSELHEGVIITNHQGIILYYNKAMAKIDDLDVSYAVGKKITDLYRLDGVQSTTMICLNTRKPVRNRVVMYRTHLGKLSNVISNVFPLFKGDEIVGAVSFTKDYQMLESIISSGKPCRVVQGKGNGTRYAFDDIVGNNRGLRHAVKTAKMSCESPSPIMLYGETGTGKELFAQSIHNHRKSSGEKFIPINCAAIPENLLEGILFGTSRGAFTGAIEKPGLFEQANCGTIFLDELDSMPLNLQAKVLRVVQEKKVRRLGSLDEIDLDIKIISAVGKDPTALITSGALRQDLFYRMGVVFIMIPPLRERRDDLMTLINHFIGKFNRALGQEVTSLSHRVATLFHNYVWPGNVRELEHVIEGAMNMVSKEPIIRLKHLPDHVVNALETSINAGQTSATTGNFRGAAFRSLASRGPSLSEIQNANEHNSLCRALEKTGGNAAGAARILGISPQSLNYKLKKYRISRKDFLTK